MMKLTKPGERGEDDMNGTEPVISLKLPLDMWLAIVNPHDHEEDQHSAALSELKRMVDAAVKSFDSHQTGE